MAGTEIDSAVENNSLKFLDDLIEMSYNRLLETFVENVKIGELLKMIELRNKIAPSKSEQQEFWSHIDKIRREQNKKTSDTRISSAASHKPDRKAKVAND